MLFIPASITKHTSNVLKFSASRRGVSSFFVEFSPSRSYKTGQNVKLRFRRYMFMKRFTSILCALCLIVGVLSGVALAPAEEAKATQEPADYPGTVTAIHFSDSEFTDYSSLAEIKTSTGSAISIGGKSKWTHGIFIIEPATGWELKEIEFNGVESPTSLQQIIADVTEVAGESYIPTKVKNLFDSYASVASSTNAFYINSSLYCNNPGKPLYVTFCQTEDEDVERCINITLNSDTFDADFEQNVGATFNVFDLWTSKGVTLPTAGYTKTDYSIAVGGINSPDIILEKQYQDENSTNYGSFKSSRNGSNSVTLTNKKTGLQHKAYISLDHTSLPLSMNSFTLPSDARIADESGTGKDAGKYAIHPVGKDLFQEITVGFTLLNGMTVEDILYDNESFSDEQGAFPVSGSVRTGWFTGEYSINNSKVSIKVNTLNEFGLLDGTLMVVLKKDGLIYTYTFGLRYRLPFSIGIKGGGNIFQPMTIGKTMMLTDFLDLGDAENTQKVYDGITKGTIELETQGLKPKFENGVFNGELIVFYPCDHINVYGYGTRIAGCNLNVPVRVTTLIEAGSSLDLTTILGDYFNSTDHSGNRWYNDFTSPESREIGAFKVTSTGPDTYSFSQDNKTFYAPSAVEGITTYTLKNYLTEITVKVCPSGSLMNSLTEVAGTTAENESVVVDVDNNTNLPKDALNQLMNQGGTGSSIVATNRNNPHTPQWFFNKENLKSEAVNDINLSVAVGAEIKNSSLNRVKGLPVGFAPNGKLPGNTVVRIYPSDSELQTFTNKNKIQLYFLNETGSLVKESGNYYVAYDDLGKAYIDVTLTHNSDFVLSSDETDTLTIPAESSGGGSGYVDSGSGSGTSSGTTETTPDTDKESTDKAAEEKDEDKNTVVTENEDGSVTKTTVTENEDGTKTTVDTTEFKDGSKAVTETTENADGTESTKTTVTDENGKFYSETVTEESVTKKGTKVEESTTTYADGSTEYTEKRTTKSGKVEETTVTLDKSGKGTASVETTKADGTTESQEFSISKSGVVRIKAFETDGTKATVPESVSVEGKEIPVTIIGKNAFAGTDVEKVTVGSNITTIGVGAFSDAASLKSIVFKAANITKIYKGAFDGIAEDAVIKITASSKKEYNRLVKLIKKSGIAGSVKFKRVK